ncbi:hypothetical protein N7457_006488 [Penicillium paradoxum]|uniref:uncharacterized protein n=1 Tax=Penicillium paradoxum TaxID=176176 RepID=UPI00254685E6|nr:uncharacterized protein N7457_006488 [Penicillium paradoxum]KAJ5781328.1 hypothetical protein N7457_006488 [Penicillium paradoxum]
MRTSTFGLWALTAGVTTAKTCYDVTVEVPVTARNGVFDNIITPETNFDATSFVLASTKQGGNITEAALSGYATVSKLYNISAQYCMPKSTGSSAYTLQILTHGMGFDKTYWDLPYNDYNYSYVEYALSQGYHTLSYDRLGLGKSSHGDAKNEIQAFLEIEGLAQLTRMVRNGEISHIKTPSKIVHVGHSFGSSQTVALSAMYPDLSDALVLTGWSTSADYMPMFLTGANFQQARLNGKNSDYTGGYLTSGDVGSNVYLFFYPPHFDTELLEFVEENKQPMTIGELMTITGLPAQSNFTGPVYVIDGENDVPFCGGDCSHTGGTSASFPAAAEKLFPSASAFVAYIHPNTGHAINVHYNATGAYKEIHDFLGAHGLKSRSHHHDHVRH